MLGVGGPAPANSAPTLGPPVRKPPPPKPLAPNATAELDTADLGGFGDDADDLAGEKTMVGASPFDDDASGPADLPDQPTQIFFSADDVVSEDPATTLRAPTATGAAGVEVSHAELYGAAPAPAAPAQRVFAAPAALPARQVSAPAPSLPPPAQPSFSSPPPGLQPAQPVSQGPLFGAPAQPLPHSGAPPFDPQQPLPGVVPLTGPTPTASFAAPPGNAARPAPAPGNNRAQLVGIALAAVVLIAAGAGIAVLLFGRPSGGTVEVQTVPAVPGDIYVDGTLLGQAPKRLEPVPAGEHIIEVRAAGYAPAQRRVMVTAGNTTMMEIAMVPTTTPPASPTALALGAQPTAPGLAAAAPTALPTAPGALGVVSPIPGLAAPSAAPPSAPGGTPGETAPAPSLAPPSAPLPVAAAAIVPTPAPPPAPSPAPVVAIPAAPAPPPAPVRAAAPTPQRAAAPAPAPTRTAPARTPAPAREPAPTRTAPTRTAAAEAPAASSARGSGTLAINTQPWARVFLDGRDTRRDTPVRDLRARAGRHTVGLRKPDGTMVEFEVEVVADETTTIIRRL